MNLSQEKMVLLLKDRQIKATSKRMEVLTLIANYNSAIPYSSLQKSLQGFDRVTLYRTLNTLLDGGVIHKASVSTDEVYYAMCRHYCTSEKHHHKHIHFKCTACKSVSCVETTSPISIEVPNASVQEIEIEVKGICETCLQV